MSVKRKLSIVDIANQLNLSATTISFILNGKSKEKRISEKVTREVLAYVEEVGYRPNVLAKSLRTGKSNIIGLMIEDIANPFFASIARHIEEKAYASGYKIIYCSTDNEPHKASELIEMFTDRHVDGYIIAPAPGLEKDIQQLLSANLPVVMFDRYLPEIKTDCVVIDNEQSCYNAIAHLIKQGHRNNAFITLVSGQTQMLERIAGYKRAQEEHSFPVIIKEIYFHADPAKTIDEIADFMQQHPQIDAILFGTNYLAVNGLKAIKKTGLQIGKDLAVIAFDDHELFELYKPPITVISQPIDEIAAKVISLLLKRLDRPDKAPKPKCVVVTANMVVRESSAYTSSAIQIDLPANH